MRYTTLLALAATLVAAQQKQPGSGEVGGPGADKGTATVDPSDLPTLATDPVATVTGSAIAQTTGVSATPTPRESASESGSGCEAPPQDTETGANTSGGYAETSGGSGGVGGGNQPTGGGSQTSGGNSGGSGGSPTGGTGGSTSAPATADAASVVAGMYIAPVAAVAAAIALL